MCKIKTTTGRALRDEFTAFEVEALKYAVDNNITAGENFPFKTEESGFTVLANNGQTISLKRESNGRELTALKADAPAPVPVEKAPEVRAPKVADNDAQGVLDALAGILNQKRPAADMEEIRRIVAEQVAEAVERIKAANTAKVAVNGVEVPALEGETLHEKFKIVIFNVKNGIHTYMTGPAGTGKNVLAEQAAKAMGLPFYCAGALQNKYELEGFVDASGNYQETEFYKAFTGGGVFLFDEIDGTAAEVLVAFNAALANGYYTFPGRGRVEAHKDFHVIAAGNTAGRGADESYNGRFQLDASTIDRFAFVRLGYDGRIELQAAAGDKSLVDFMHAVRDAVERMGLPYTATPRAMSRVAKYAAGGFSAADALAYGLAGSWAGNDIKAMQVSLKGNGKWFDAFREL